MRYVIILLAAMLTACQNAEPLVTSKTTNPTVKVDTLFTKDGCTIYRFEDRWEYHYFVKCENTSAVLSRQSCGKNCTREETIQTEYQ